MVRHYYTRKDTVTSFTQNAVCSNAYKEGVFTAVANSCFYIKFIVLIGSSSVTLSELEKVLKWKSV